MTKITIKRRGFKNVKEEALGEVETALTEAIKGEGKPLNELIHPAPMANKE